MVDSYGRIIGHILYLNLIVNIFCHDEDFGGYGEDLIVVGLRRCSRVSWWGFLEGKIWPMDLKKFTVGSSSERLVAVAKQANPGKAVDIT